MDKLAGFKDTKMQNKLIEKYSIYFNLDFSFYDLTYARKVISDRANEEYDESRRFFLLRCRDKWFNIKSAEESK